MLIVPLCNDLKIVTMSNSDRKHKEEDKACNNYYITHQHISSMHTLKSNTIHKSQRLISITTDKAAREEMRDHDIKPPHVCSLPNSSSHSVLHIPYTY